MLWKTENFMKKIDEVCNVSCSDVEELIEFCKIESVS